MPVENGNRILFRNATEVAAELLRRAILEGRLAPGERLKEEQLAEQFGISRTPVREALLVLQTEGLVEAQPNRGSMVRAYTPAEISDVYETRAVLEGHSAARAARNATMDTVDRLRASNDRFAALMDGEKVELLVRENLVFHKVVLDATQSPSLNTLVGAVTQIPLVYRVYIWYSEGAKRTSLYYHREIADAIANRAAGPAEKLMREHIMEARTVLVARLEADRAGGAAGLRQK
jgi:DNA-binding GntR family transcriptional regulator